MANIKPFKGYRYNTEKTGDLKKVVSPPYYNIKPTEKEILYNLSKYNSVRLFSGMNDDKDDETHNRFTRAAEYLKNWINDGILVRDEEPAIYMYEQTLDVHNVQYKNRSFVALVELEEFSHGVIMPCEETREVSRQDRYDFLTHTNADLSMISCLYMEREKDLLNLMTEVSEGEPAAEFDSFDDIHQRLWKITDKKTIDFITERFKDIQLYITDGQTRYETCLKYRDYMRENNPNHTGDEPYNYTMVSLSNSSADGIAILPVHRKIKMPKGFKSDYFIAGIQDHFKVEKIIVDLQDEQIADTMKKQIATARHETKIAVYYEGDFFYRITLLDKEYIKKEVLPDMSEAYCSLDMVVLHNLIIDDVLHIKKDDYAKCVHSSRSAHRCVESVENGESDVVFIMNPVKSDQIRSVVAAGEKLPLRTLSVFPKPSVGVLINIMED